LVKPKGNGKQKKAISPRERRDGREKLNENLLLNRQFEFPRIKPGKARLEGENREEDRDLVGKSGLVGDCDNSNGIIWFNHNLDPTLA
jgi:hypothetical protein